MTMTRAVVAILAVAQATVVSAATFTVTSSDPTGPGSLEQTIHDANDNPGRDEIRFAVANATIDSDGLFPISEAVDVNGLLGDGSRLVISMPVQTQVNAGFKFGASTSTLTNVHMESVPNAAVLVGTGATGVRISDNTFDENVIRIDGNGNFVERNVLPLGNVFAEIRLNGNGNFVGDNTTRRILVTQFADSNQIGGPGHGNTVMTITNLGGDNLVIAHNTLPGGVPGITAIPLHGTGSGTILRNSIGAYDRGIVVVSGAGYEISENHLDNVGIAIDLGNDGPTPNDPAPDADAGPNNLQNFPVLTSATFAGGSLAVTGSLTSAPLTSYRIELFSPTFLGSFNVTTDGTGVANFSQSIAAATPAAGEAVVSTATNLVTTDTSELGNAIAAHLAPVPAASAWALIALAAALAAIVIKRI
jgi:hypothetical protein